MWPAHEALERVLRQNRSWLLRQAQQLCGWRFDPEDLVQDVCLRFMNAFRAQPLPDERGCASWLATALYNAFISHLRKAEAQVRAEGDPSFRDSVISMLEPRLPTVYDAVTDDELDSAVRALTPKQRETFEASAAGRSYEEIARLLDIARSAVAKRLHDARRHVRKRLLEAHPPRGE